MLCLGKVDVATGRITLADPEAVVTLTGRVRALFGRAAGKELTTEAVTGYVGARRADIEAALGTLYLAGLVSVRRTRERYSANGSRIVNRCYWRAREPRTRPRRKGVGA